MKLRQMLAVSVLGLALIGCGGGSSSGSSGSSNVSNISVPVDATTNQTGLALSKNSVVGIVDDDIVEGAEVYIDFGDSNSTKAITNSKGEFRINLTDEEVAKINPVVPEGADGYKGGFFIVATKNSKILRNAIDGNVTEGKAVCITNDTEAYAQFLEAVGSLDAQSLELFNYEIAKGRIAEGSVYYDFIKDFREDVKSYFYGGAKPDASVAFNKAYAKLNKERLASIASSGISTPQSVMSGGEIYLGDGNISSSDISLAKLDSGRYVVGSGSDSAKTVYIKTYENGAYKIIPLNIAPKTVTQVASQSVTPQDGATLGDVGGGIVAYVPPYALNDATNITLNRVQSSGETADGKVVLDMQPSGLNFEMPITVGIKYSDYGITDPYSATFEYGSPASGYESASIVGVDSASGMIYLNISHFSTIVVKQKGNSVLVLPFSDANPSKNNVYRHINDLAYINATGYSHTGIDIMSNSSQKIRAVCSGQIIKGTSYDTRKETLDKRSSFGNSEALYNINFVLKCNEGIDIYDKPHFYYFHSRLLDNVSDGQYVVAGKEIATPFRWDGKNQEGNTHLHLTAKNGDHTWNKQYYCIKKNGYQEINSNLVMQENAVFRRGSNCASDEYSLYFGAGTGNGYIVGKKHQWNEAIFTDAGFIDPEIFLELAKRQPDGTQLQNDLRPGIDKAGKAYWNNTGTLYYFNNYKQANIGKSNSKQYELYVSGFDANTNFQLLSYPNLVTSSLEYTFENVKYRKLYQRDNNNSIFTLTPNEVLAPLNNSLDTNGKRVFVLPLNLNYSGGYKNVPSYTSQLFVDGHNKVRILPFINDTQDVVFKGANPSQYIGGDLFKLNSNREVLFPLPHQGKHKLQLVVEEPYTVGALSCALKLTSEDIGLTIDDQTVTANGQTRRPLSINGAEVFELSGNGYVSCKANQDIYVDSLFVRPEKYGSEDIQAQAIGQANLSNILEHGAYKNLIAITCNGKTLQTYANFGRQYKLTTSKPLAVDTTCTITHKPVSGASSTVSNNSITRATTSVSPADYKPQSQRVVFLAGQTSVNLPTVTLYKNEKKSSVKIRAINALNGSPLADANVTVRFGTDRDDNTTAAFSGMTNASGEFAMANVPYGQYSVVLNKAGYVGTNLNLTVDATSAASTDLLLSPLSQTSNILFEDNFDTVNLAKWRIYREGSHIGGQYIDNSAVKTSNGILSIFQDRTDDGPTMYSVPISFNMNKKIQIERRIKVHANNRYYNGALRILDVNKKALCAIEYINQSYQTNENSFILYSSDWSTGSKVAPIWDEWFNEILIYDPLTGGAKYQINGLTIEYQCKKAENNNMLLFMQSYGWWTDHYMDLDNVVVKQID